MKMHADFAGIAGDEIAGEFLKHRRLRHGVINHVADLQAVSLAQRLKSGNARRVPGPGLLGSGPEIVALGVNRDDKGQPWGRSQLRGGHGPLLIAGRGGGKGFEFAGGPCPPAQAAQVRGHAAVPVRATETLSLAHGALA